MKATVPSRLQRLLGGWSANLTQLILGITQQLVLVPIFLHYRSSDMLAAWLALASVGLHLDPAALPDSLTAHSEFIKRATCARCGGPKRLPSKTAYLYCDFCGALVDYDFRLANAGTNAGITNTVYERLITPYQPAIAQAKAMGDRDGYRGIMLHVFRQWIEQCPQAVWKQPSTRSPGATRVTASPTATTVPTYSWPIVKPGSICTRPW